MGSYKPSYHLEDGEGPRARVDYHFLAKTKLTVHPPPATPTKFSRVDSTKLTVYLTNRDLNMYVVYYFQKVVYFC